MLSVSKYIVEPPLPEVNMNIFSWIASFFEARRPLKPSRTERAPVASKQMNKCTLLVQVVRAYNIPIRKQQEERDAFRHYRTIKMREAEREGMERMARSDPNVAATISVEQQKVVAEQKREAEKMEAAREVVEQQHSDVCPVFFILLTLAASTLVCISNVS